MACSAITGGTVKACPYLPARCLAENIAPRAAAAGANRANADRARPIVVDRLHAALHEVRLVPEAGAAGVLDEVLPPPPQPAIARS